MNQQVVEQFYTAFSNRNIDSMMACYHDDIIFEDPAFGELHGKDAKDMWRMLVSRLNDNATIEHQIIEASEDTIKAKWIARYQYGPKKRQVENHIHAILQFKDGLIIDHRDIFDIWKWSRQAIGMPGLLLGWTTFLKKKINSMALKSLHNYQKKAS